MKKVEGYDYEPGNAEMHSMTTRHSKSRQNLDFCKTLNRESFAKESNKLKGTRNGGLRASIQHTQSTSNLNKSALFHKKRNS